MRKISETHNKLSMTTMSNNIYNAIFIFVLALNATIKPMEDPGQHPEKRKNGDAPHFDGAKRQRTTSVDDFFKAIKNGDINAVRSLLDSDAGLINAVDCNRWHPIHCAARYGHRAIAELLLTADASQINATDEDGWQPIHLAAHNGHRDIVELLLTADASQINATTTAGWQPIHYAARFCQRDIVELLLTADASQINAVTTNGLQPIHLAVQHYPYEVSVPAGKTTIAVLLVANGGSISSDKFLHRSLNELFVRFARSDLFAPFTIRLSGRYEAEVTISDVFRMAAGQNAQETVQTILDNHRDQLVQNEEEDEGGNVFAEALVGAAIAGHLEIVRLLHNYMNNDDNLRELVPQALSRALARAAALCRLDVIGYLILQDTIYNNDDFSLLCQAGQLMKKLLSRFSDLEIASDQRLQTYRSIFRMLAARQQLRLLTLLLIRLDPAARRSAPAPVSDEEAESLVPTHIRSIPVELWEIILNALARNHLCDIYSSYGNELFKAVREGDVDSVRSHLDNGAIIDAVDSGGVQPIHSAVQYGHAAIVELLLTADPSQINAADREGWQPIHAAAQNGHAAIVELLLTNGANVDAANNNGWRPIHRAVRYGQTAIVELLLAADASQINATTSDGWQPIHYAVRHGHTSIVELLLTADASQINVTATNGWQPIHIAAEYGQTTIVELLLAADDSQINAADCCEMRPIHHAARYGQTAIVELLLATDDSQINAADRSGMRPIHHAVRYGQTAIVEFLLAADDSQINAADRDGMRPIHHAARTGKMAIVELLLAADDSQINAANRCGWRPIHIAARYDQTAIVKLLLTADDSQINATTTHGSRPVQCAARKGHANIVVLLIAHGANISSAVSLQRSLNELFVRFACSDLFAPFIIRLSGRYEAKVTISDVFRMAAGQNSQETVQTILDNHRDQLVENEEEDEAGSVFVEALVGAATAGHLRIVRLLHNYMNSDDKLRGLLPEALARALARAATHCRVDVINYLIDYDLPYNRDSYHLLNKTGELLHRLLGSFSPSEIIVDDRLRTYSLIRQVLAERQQWRLVTFPLIRLDIATRLRGSEAITDEEADAIVPSPIRRMPGELWQVILNMNVQNQSYDKAKYFEEALMTAIENRNKSMIELLSRHMLTKSIFNLLIIRS